MEHIFQKWLNFFVYFSCIFSFVFIRALMSEDTGSNPVEVLTILGFYSQLLNLRS